MRSPGPWLAQGRRGKDTSKPIGCSVRSHSDHAAGRDGSLHASAATSVTLLSRQLMRLGTYCGYPTDYTVRGAKPLPTFFSLCEIVEGD